MIMIHSDDVARLCACVQVARRCWSGNKLAADSIQAAMSADDNLLVTLPYDVDDCVIADALQQS